MTRTKDRAFIVPVEGYEGIIERDIANYPPLKR